MPDTLRERVAKAVIECIKHSRTFELSTEITDAILAIFAEERVKAEAREAKLVAKLAHWREKAQRWALQSEKKESSEADFREALREVLGTEEISTAHLIASNALATVKEGKE